MLLPGTATPHRGTAEPGAGVLTDKELPQAKLTAELLITLTGLNRLSTRRRLQA